MGMVLGTGRKMLMFARPMTHCFFSRASHNLTQLKTAKLGVYFRAIPNCTTLLKALNSKGQFLGKEPLTYDANQFLQEEIPQHSFLEKTPIELMNHSLRGTSFHSDSSQLERILTQSLPKEFKSLNRKITFYILLIEDVFTNKLAQRNYESGLPEYENVSEQLHGLQAGKLATLLGFSRNEVLAMLFHDLARPTHEQDDRGHASHHSEGHHILMPLGLSTSFAWYHAYAKFLLKELCEPYPTLLSPVSHRSLTLQKQNMLEQIANLHQHNSQALAKTLYKLMFLRLIDDFSKIPQMALNKNVEYLTQDKIRHLLLVQIIEHCEKMAKSVKNKKQTAGVFNNQLEIAMAHLLRPQAFSNNPALYREFYDYSHPGISR